MFSAKSESASPAQQKAKMQQQYRAKEADAIEELRKLLCDISRSTATRQTRIETIVQGKPASRI